MSNPRPADRRNPLLTAPRLGAVLCSLACALACSRPGDVVTDADGSSGTGEAPGTSWWSGGSGGSGSDGVDTTGGPGSSDGAVGTTGAADSTGIIDASSDDGLGSDSGSTGDTGEGPLAGEWCGNQGTGAMLLGGTTDGSFVHVSAPHGAPLVFVIWKSDAGIEAMIYDIAAGSWSEPEAVGDVQPSVAAAAVDAGGNAWVVYVVNEEPPQAIVRRYDAATAAWSPAAPLEGSFKYLSDLGVSTTAGGDAIVVVEDQVGPQEHSLVQWFHDAASGQWSAPIVVGPVPPSAPAPWAQDPITGDAVVAVRLASDHVQLRHRSASTGAWTTQNITEVVTNLGAAGVASIGDGAFVALTEDSGFQTDGSIHAHVFSSGSWQTPKALGVDYDLRALRIVGSPDGRALVTWFWSSNILHARMFDIDTGWDSDWLVNSPEQQTISGWWANALGVLDAGGFVVAWSQIHDGLIRTYARRYDAVAGWDVQSELDPLQAYWSRISSIDALGPGLTRAMWKQEDDFFHTTGRFYACHTPGGGWSAPTWIPISAPVIEPHPAGVLVRGRAATGELTAEFYEAL